MSSLKSYTIEGSKVIMNFTHSNNTDTMLHTWAKTEIVIYDLFTQEYQCIQIPPELIELSGFDDPDGKYGTTYPRYIYIKDYVAAMRVIDNNILAILLENGYFLYYSLNTTGIEENNYLTATKLYPNPTTSNSTITLELAEAAQVNITLCDILGREIKQIYNAFTDAGTFTHSFATQDLPKGIYYLKIFIGGEVMVEKVVVN
jgi:hypothetical protein